MERGPQAAVADTTVWTLGPNGVLAHREVKVRERSGTLAARERAVATSRWWTKNREVDGRKMRVVCMSQQPGRNSQCAQVRIDTVSDARGAPLRRLTWTGVTFRKQHWTFSERTRR
jgi:hypothetical protein